MIESHSLKCKKKQGTLVWTIILNIFQHQQIMVHFSNRVYKDFLRKLPLPLVYESNVSISTLTSYSPLLELPLRENFILKWKDLIWKQHSWAAKSFLWTFCLWQKHQQWQEMMHIEVSVEITFSPNFLWKTLKHFWIISQYKGCYSNI